MHDLLAGLAIIVVLGVSAQWLAWRFRIPSILLLLIFGFAAGPGLEILNPDQMFGDLLFPLVSLSVAVILFEGGLTLKFAELGKSRTIVTFLISIGMLISWIVSWWAAKTFLGLDFSLAALLGAILTVSGPTVVLPLLRHVKPKAPLGSILKWEGILIDPVGAVFAVLILEAIINNRFHAAIPVVIEGVIGTAIVGTFLGVVGGVSLIRLIMRGHVPDYLQIPVSLMILVVIFVGSNHFYHESGLLAVTVMGMILANTRKVSIHEILEFKENLRVILISLLFILLAARIDINDFHNIGMKEALFLGAIIVIGRPASVFVSTFRSGLNWREKTFLCFVAPRGIVAAAVSSLFALSLEQAGIADAHFLVTYTFIVIVGTVTFYGLISPVMATLLGVRQSQPQGVLFVGANGFSRALAKELESEGFRTILVDTNRSKINIAHMEGLTAYHGNVLSEHVEELLDLDGIGRLLALTPNDEANSLACVHFADSFGKDQIYQLAPSGGASLEKSSSLSARFRGKFLFGEGDSFAKLNERFVRGAAVKTTELSEEFDYKEYVAHYAGRHTALFTISEKGELGIVEAGEGLSIEPTMKIVSLIESKEEASS